MGTSLRFSVVDVVKEVVEGAASCVELGKRLAELHPESAEAKEAAALTADNYKRLYPKIKEVENLLIQRVSVFDKDKKFELCKATGATDVECEGRATGPSRPCLVSLSCTTDSFFMTSASCSLLQEPTMSSS